ncbi:hypothetical protein COU91_01650 [Candidatus Saccharibacteria bacterium CG10_big_fil_rev_8_21_14_0_10_47_8]|nr:MAG: hypothetical protein COU91_01650 [Candidatus Saccharibacteria bacterium CG10_big_fil_rev_8_21_14_0_10_47_8]
MQKINKNEQQGIAHLLLIVLIAVVVAGIGFAAWRVSSNKKASNGTSSATTAVADKTVQDACNKQLNDKDFCKFASNYKLTGVSYHSVITTVASGKTSTISMDVDGKDNSSMVTSGAGKETAAFISLNKATYMKDESSGSWLKYPAADSTTAPKETDPSSDIKIDSSNLTENNTISYKSLGKEACGKLTCFKYQVVDSQNPGTTQYIWFDTKDYMMQRWSSKDANGSTDMTFTYKSVTIKEPSPVTDFSAQSSADLQAAQEAAAAATANQ